MRAACALDMQEYGASFSFCVACFYGAPDENTIYLYTEIWKMVMTETVLCLVYGR